MYQSDAVEIANFGGYTSGSSTGPWHATYIGIPLTSGKRFSMAAIPGHADRRSRVTGAWIAARAFVFISCAPLGLQRVSAVPDLTSPPILSKFERFPLRVSAMSSGRLSFATVVFDPGIYVDDEPCEIVPHASEQNPCSGGSADRSKELRSASLLPRAAPVPEGRIGETRCAPTATASEGTPCVLIS